MTDQPFGAGGDDPTRPRFTDKRRIDPETGEVREQPAAGSAADSGADPGVGGGAGAQDGGEAGADDRHPVVAALEASERVAQERLEDLQRLQAEYVNYRRRVERDRLVARDQTVVALVESLLGTLDEVELARQHGELVGPFAAVAEKLEAALGKFGWERFGAAGEPFDPTVHEALMHAPAEGVTEPTVVQVLQPGYRVGDRVVRAARVAVAGPED